MELFDTATNLWIVILLTFLYFISAAISTFDTRIIQAQKEGAISSERSFIPAWTGLFAILMWATWLALAFISWKYAILLFLIKFILKVLPVLEYVGALILLPFVGRRVATIPYLINKQRNKAHHAARKLNKAKTKEDVHEALKDFKDS